MVGRHHLPEDVLVDILLRLPVEPLLRFRCVCKHWYALIKSPSFIEKHFHHNNNRAHLLICNLTMSWEEGRSVDFSLLPDKIVPGVHPELRILHQLRRVTDFTSVAGPVDGLFLLVKSKPSSDDSLLALWNPATRELWPLPPLSFELQPFRDHDYKCALGFDPSTRDYKVLWIRIFYDDVSPNCLVNVYSLNNNSWKDLKSEFPYRGSLHEPIGSTCLNGVYYWLSELDNKSCRICSFDMCSEQFREIQGPVIPNLQWGKLMLRGDLLAILVGVNPGKPMISIYDVWVMNQQEDSWTKVLTVQPLIKVAHWPRGVGEDDKMIFEITETSQLVLYDPTTRLVTDLGFQLDLINGRSWVSNYKESLVPIKRTNDIQGNDIAVEQIDHFFNMFDIQARRSYLKKIEQQRTQGNPT